LPPPSRAAGTEGTVGGAAAAENEPAQGSLSNGSDSDANNANNANDADDATDAIVYFNARRMELGLPPIALHPDVVAAAAAHARYLMIQGENGHTEQPGKLGFTGVDVADRLSVRLPVAGASEVLTRYGSSYSDEESNRALFASPYHRGVILFDWQFGGAALQRAQTTVIVVDFANIRPTLAANELVAYPYDGQTDVPAAWTDDELPDPLGDDSHYSGQRVGFPITLSGGPNAHIAWRRATLTDAGGHSVTCQIAPLRPADSARNTAICTPLAPLHAHTLYRIQATGVLTQLSRFTTIAPFSLAWTFSTA
jgi:hypothetical protein